MRYGVPGIQDGGLDVVAGNGADGVDGLPRATR
jgi:hypothetical protein